MSSADQTVIAVSPQSLIERFEEGIQLLNDALSGTPEAIMDRAPAPGKWSIRQIAAHLADAEIVGAARIRWVIADPGTPIKAYDQDKWAEALQYQQQSLGESLAVFRALRTSTAALLRRIPEPVWASTGKHEERGDVSLAGFVALYANHTENHVKQIRAIRKQFGG